MRAWEEIIDEGGSSQSRFTFVETGPAASVMPLARTIDGSLNLILIDELRGIGEQELKTIGGYCRLGETYEACALRVLLAEAGITTSGLHELGKMVGYTVIKLPIKLFFVSDYIFARKPAENIKIVQMDLEKAIDAVLQNQVGDEAAAMSILLISELERRGLLVK